MFGALRVPPWAPSRSHGRGAANSGSRLEPPSLHRMLAVQQQLKAAPEGRRLERGSQYRSGRAQANTAGDTG